MTHAELIAQRAARARLCKCGCNQVRPPAYRSPYLPGHRNRNEPITATLCGCGCNQPIPNGVRYRILPGHNHPPQSAGARERARRALDTAAKR